MQFKYPATNERVVEHAIVVSLLGIFFHEYHGILGK